MMHAILKVVGVTPEAIARLHVALKQPNLRTEGEHCQPDLSSDSTDIAGSPKQIPYVEIMDSKLHSASGTYTVTLRLNLVICSYRQGENTDLVGGKQDVFPLRPLVFPPLVAFCEVFKSIDSRLLPEIEKIEKVSVTEDVTDHLVKKLSDILGDQSAFDICNLKTHEVIIPARRKVTRTLIRKLAENLKDLYLEEDADVVIRILKRVRDESL